MNLWIRFLIVYLMHFRRVKLVLPQDASVLNFRVWPHDLDVSLHMNNGRYLTIMDLGRIDMLMRTGLWKTARVRHWTPIANAVVIRFRRELRPFQRFTLETKVASWSETHVIIEQTFKFADGAGNGQIAAKALFKGGLYDRAARAFVPMTALMSATGIASGSPAAAEHVSAFLASDDALRRSTAG